jgi:hypothetical protein
MSILAMLAAGGGEVGANADEGAMTIVLFQDFLGGEGEAGLWRLIFGLMCTQMTYSSTVT